MVKPSAPRSDCPALIVYEKRPRWVPELQRQFAADDVRIVGCRSLGDVTERAVGVTRGAILMELGAEASACLRFLSTRAVGPAALPVFVQGSRRTAELEWSIRDLGAANFFPEKIPSSEMAALCRRQWSNRS